MRRWEGWSDLQIGVAVVLTLPMLLPCMPFVLPHLIWRERRRRCPVCGHRGTLPVLPPASTEDEDGPLLRRRINPEAVRLCCQHCGTEFSRAELQAAGVPV